MSAMGVAVVTGAGSGLGRTIARALLGAGWQVALAGRRSELLTETAKAADGADLGWPSENALVGPADVTSPPSVAALFDAVRDRWGTTPACSVPRPRRTRSTWPTGSAWSTPTSPAPSCAPSTRCG